MRKKIIYFITKANWGGAQKYVFDLASEMTGRDDYEVLVAYGKPFGELSKKLKETGIQTIKIEGLERDVNLFSEFKVAKNLWKVLKEEKPDIIHLNSPKIGGLGAFLGRLANIDRIIYTAHGWTFNEKRPLWQIILIKYFSWVTILLSHKTIVLAKKEYKQVIDWFFVNDKKLVQIYNGIKPIYFLNKEEAENKLTKILDDDLVVGTITELHKNKGLKYGIKAFKKLVRRNNKLKFIIIGEGEEREYLEKKIKKYDLENNVYLVGEIENASQYLKAFDIFLLPSIKEGFPFVLLEAGLAKLPVIATEVGGIPELISDGENGILIGEKEEDEIEDALEKLIKDENLRNKLSENLYTKVKEKFSFETMVENTKDLY
ncbi:MAG: glycosyltransferase family 4 protein [Candidatus Pacebacteria bacterium]|nr:glycosyltransferase family 4 protein [Candidatus Paceibacterota bacterium]